MLLLFETNFKHNNNKVLNTFKTPREFYAPDLMIASQTHLYILI